MHLGWSRMPTRAEPAAYTSAVHNSACLYNAGSLLLGDACMDRQDETQASLLGMALNDKLDTDGNIWHIHRLGGWKKERYIGGKEM